MELPIRFPPCVQIFFSQGLFHRTHCRIKRLKDRLFVLAPGKARCCLRFEHCQNFVDLSHVIQRHRQNPGASPWDQFNQPISLQAQQRFAHRRSAHAEAQSKFGFGRLETWRQSIGQYIGLQIPIGAIDLRSLLRNSQSSALSKQLLTYNLMHALNIASRVFREGTHKRCRRPRPPLTLLMFLALWHR